MEITLALRAGDRSVPARGLGWMGRLTRRPMIARDIENLRREWAIGLSSQLTGGGSDEKTSGEFGANEWLVDELYERYLVDKNSVDESWWPVLESYHQTAAAGSPAPATDAAPSADAPVAVAEAAAAPAAAPAHPITAPITVIGSQPTARTTSVAAKPV